MPHTKAGKVKEVARFIAIASGFAAISSAPGTLIGISSSKIPKDVKSYQEEVKKVAERLREEGIIVQPAIWRSPKKSNVRKGGKSRYMPLEAFLQKNPNAVSGETLKRIEKINTRFESLKPSYQKMWKRMNRNAARGALAGFAVGALVGASINLGLARAKRRRKEFKAAIRRGKR